MAKKVGINKKSETREYDPRDLNHDGKVDFDERSIAAQKENNSQALQYAKAESAFSPEIADAQYNPKASEEAKAAETARQEKVVKQMDPTGSTSTNLEYKPLTAGLNANGTVENNSNVTSGSVTQPEQPVQGGQAITNNGYKYSMGIWDAFKNGQFGDPNSEDAKARRNYYIMDALSNAARNMGQDFGKISAAYAGGNYNPEYTQSQWDARNQALTEKSTAQEASQIATEDEQLNRAAKRIQNANEADRRAMGIKVKSVMDKLNPNDPVQLERLNKLGNLYNALTTGGGLNGDWKATLANVGLGILTELGI